MAENHKWLTIVMTRKDGKRVEQNFSGGSYLSEYWEKWKHPRHNEKKAGGKPEKD